MQRRLALAMTPSETSRAPWTLVVLLCATAAAGYICRVNVSTAGIFLMQEFHFSQPQMGRVFSAFLVGYTLSMVPGGALADRWGARRTLTLAAWAWVVLTLMQAGIGWGPFVSTAFLALPTFMLVRFLLGIAAAPTYPAAAAGVASWVPAAAHGRATGIVLASIGLGSAISGPLVTLVTRSWGWRLALVASALPVLAVSVLWLFVRRDERGAREDVSGGAPRSSTRRALLRSPRFLLLTASYTLQGYVGYIFVFWSYLYLVQERRFELVQGAWLSSAAWLLTIVTIPLGGWIADRAAQGRLGPRWGLRVVPMTGLAGSGALISFGAHTGNAWLAWMALALATALVLSVEGPFWSCLTHMAGASSGTAGGVMNLGSNVGGLISPALTPVLAAWVGWENALHVAAGLAVVAALLWLGIDPGREVTGP